MEQVMKVRIFRLLAIGYLIILFVEPRLMFLLLEPFRGVSSVPLKPHVLETISGRVYSGSYTICQR